MQQTREDIEYLRFDPFDGDRDCRVIYQTRPKMVTTRKKHQCVSPSGILHLIPPGTRARYESALMEEGWKRYYVCTKCLDKWLAEWIDEEDQMAEDSEVFEGHAIKNMRAIRRREDMGGGSLELYFCEDGDAHLIVREDGECGFGQSVEFCLSGCGSPKTLKALRILYEAMKEDEKDKPQNLRPGRTD